MPTFAYRAADPEGRVTEGVMDAEEKAAVARKLQDLGLIPIRISSGRDGASKTVDPLGLFGLGRISDRDVLAFTKELTSLVRAGIPIDRALRIIKNSLQGKRYFQKVIAGLLRDVVSGASLADALASHPEVFSRLYISMVSAGESSGSLETALERVCSYLERSRELKGRILSAAIYPAVLTVVSGLSIVVLLVYVIPKFAATFKDIGVPLPLPTMALLWVSDLTTSYWWVALIMVAAALVLFRQYINTPEGSSVWNMFILRAPIVGGLVQKIETARFAQTLGTILKGGVPILKSLSIAKEVASNTVFSRLIGELHARVKRGEPIGNSLRGKEFIPPMAVEMIVVGEESGRLADMLLETAKTLDEQVGEDIKRLLSLLEPALILVMGLIVGTIVVSMLVAIFSINEIPF